jgi:hypothetical protein
VEAAASLKSDELFDLILSKAGTRADVRRMIMDRR